MMPTSKQAGPPLSMRLVREIRTRIIVGTYPQGSRLTEHRLAADLDVSRIPLREAIPQLEAEGFLLGNPRRGVTVRRWTEASVHDLVDARLAIEPRAALLSARRAAAGEPMTALNDSLTRSEIELRTGDALQVSTANAVFHQALVSASGNELLATLMKSVAGRMTWLFYLTKQRDPHRACAEHRAIAESINDGDGDLAESLTFAHIEAGRRPSLESMAKLLSDSE
jgi:DNA-binding GntR family transcriptional regulator